MAFPRLNMSSYWLCLAGGLAMVASFFAPQGAPNSGWTSYPATRTMRHLQCHAETSGNFDEGAP
jgi:heme/copper-type cytochrome/quinol oxidase subunit 1